MKTFVLYGTSACHLCELALQMIAEASAGTAEVGWREVDISQDDALFERFGLLIPVLQHPDQRELNWPFNPQQLQRFLAS